jgi:hypothetical protein
MRMVVEREYSIFCVFSVGSIPLLFTLDSPEQLQTVRSPQNILERHCDLTFRLFELRHDIFDLNLVSSRYGSNHTSKKRLPSH